MEYSNINIDTNKKWDHARSALTDIEKKQRLAELDYMRELFNERLPVGEELMEIQSYFNDIQQIIEKDRPVKNEQFSPEREIIDPETNGQIPYRYYSSSLSHKRAIASGGSNDKCSDQSNSESEPSEQDMGFASSSRQCDDVQTESTQSPYIPHMAQCSGGPTPGDKECGSSGGDTTPNRCEEGELGCCKLG